MGYYRYWRQDLRRTLTGDAASGDAWGGAPVKCAIRLRRHVRGPLIFSQWRQKRREAKRFAYFRMTVLAEVDYLMGFPGDGQFIERLCRKYPSARGPRQSAQCSASGRIRGPARVG